MKRSVLAIILGAVMAFSLTACGDLDKLQDELRAAYSQAVEEANQKEAGQKEVAEKVENEEVEEAAEIHLEETEPSEPVIAGTTNASSINRYISGDTIDLIKYFEDLGFSPAGVREGVGISAWYGDWNMEVVLGAVYARNLNQDGSYILSRNETLFGAGDTTILKIKDTDYTVKMHIINVLPTMVECVMKAGNDDNPFQGAYDQSPHFEANTRVDPKTEYSWFWSYN